MSADKYNYIWRWKTNKHWTDGSYVLAKYVGKRCRMVARGKMCTALIEFDDGFMVYASWRGLRKVPDSGKQMALF